MQLAQAHSRTLQTKERILAEHREELAGLQKALLKERLRQKRKLRDRLKKLGREIKPDLDFTLKLRGLHLGGLKTDDQGRDTAPLPPPLANQS